MREERDAYYKTLPDPMDAKDGKDDDKDDEPPPPPKGDGGKGEGDGSKDEGDGLQAA